MYDFQKVFWNVQVWLYRMLPLPNCCSTYATCVTITCEYMCIENPVFVLPTLLHRLNFDFFLVPLCIAWGAGFNVISGAASIHTKKNKSKNGSIWFATKKFFISVYNHIYIDLWRWSWNEYNRRSLNPLLLFN